MYSDLYNNIFAPKFALKLASKKHKLLICDIKNKTEWGSPEKTAAFTTVIMKEII